MTLTVNSDCTSLQIVSTLIDDYIATPTVDLTLSFEDCEGTTYEYDIVEGTDVTAGTPNFATITPAQIISATATEFPDGVYQVTLTADDSGTITTEVQCMLVDCDLECRVFDFQAENLTSRVSQYYEALKLGETCDNCSCTGMCSLYNKILDLLANNTENDCGCQ